MIDLYRRIEIERRYEKATRAEVIAALGCEWWCSAPYWQTATLDKQYPIRTEGFTPCTPNKPHGPGCHWAIPQGDTDE